MRFSSDRKASVTPLFAIVLVGIVGLNFMMYDSLRIKALTDISNTLNTYSAYSALSMFDKTFQESYGLYVLSNEKKDEIEGRVYEILESGAVSGIMKADVTKAGVDLLKSLDDIETLEEEISSLMQYKSVSNGLELITEKLKTLIDGGKVASGSAEQKKIASLCDEFQNYEKLLSSKVTDANGFFDTVYSLDDGSFTENIEDLVLPDNIPYEETVANMLKNAIKIYETGVLIYKPVCYALICHIEDMESIQKKAIDLLNELNGDLKSGKVNQSESLASSILKLRTDVLGTNLSSLKETAVKNYERFVKAENSYNKLVQTIKAGEKIPKDTILNAISVISNSYKEYEKVDYSTKSEIGEASNLSYAITDASSAAGEFFALCKSEIPEEIYKALPSKTGDNTITIYLSDFVNTTDALNKATESMTDHFYVYDYVSTYFYDASQYKNSQTRYLTAEIEYIINGKSSDKENINASYYEIFAIREMLNVAYLMTDREKMEIVDGVSEGLSLLSDGYGKEVYKTILIGAWATSEAVNDMLMLKDGKSVPLIKQKSDWKISIDGLLENQECSTSSTGGNITNMKYGDYLKIILALVPNTTKLKRIQDLLELNMYKTKNKYVKISEFYTGISVDSSYLLKTFVVLDNSNRNRYVWEKKYEAYFVK